MRSPDFVVEPRRRRSDVPVSDPTVANKRFSPRNSDVPTVTYVVTGVGSGEDRFALNLGEEMVLFVHTHQPITLNAAGSDSWVYISIRMNRIFGFRWTLHKWVPGSSSRGSTKQLRIVD
jgi:hypothetical protein